jgi:hypothetical protein
MVSDIGGGVAVREFTDSGGVEWRVWDVNPAQLHPATRAEDYMGNLMDGWLAFESAKSKRRLEAPYPSQWTTFAIPELEDLCRRASPVVARRARSVSGERRAVTAAQLERDAVHSTDSLRTFASPRGREWTVRLHECLDEAAAPRTVLRFTANDIVVELDHWPDDWRGATVQEFALMLLDANPPRRTPGPGPQRRRADRPEA